MIVHAHLTRFKWSRRKAAKEEDVRELKEVLEEGRRQLGQEEQQVHALNAQAAQLQEQVVEARHNLQVYAISPSSLSI